MKLQVYNNFLIIINILISKLERIINQNLALLVIVSYYMSVQLWRPTQLSIAGINFSMFDYVTLFWIFVFFLSKNSLKIEIKYIKLEMFVLLCFIFYAGLEVLYGMYGLKSLSLYFQLLRDIFIFIIVVHFMKKTDIDAINRFIFKFASWLGILMLFLYILYLKTGLLPLNIFEYGEFKSIRFGGLAIDANFYAFLMSLAFLIGYYEKNKILNIKFKYFYMLIVGINIVITISRSVMATLLFTLVLTALIFERKFSKKIKMITLLLILLSIFLYIATIPLPGLNISVYEWYVLRSTQGTPRFEMWMTLLDYIQLKPFFGYGLRASEELLGGTGHYAHSSYIELLSDYGIFGTMIFISFLLLTFSKGLKIVKENSSYKAWLHSYIMLLMLFGGFTLLYWPFLWVTFAVILGGYINEKNRFNNYIIQ